MSADPADIARYTTDGVLIVAPQNPAVSAAIAAGFIDAKDGSAGEIEYFFDDPADAQAMLDELFGYLSQVQPPYVAVEIDDSLGLGSTVPIAPRVPCFMITDDVAGFSAVARVRGYAVDLGSDRYSVELIK